jgi:hypothetical protein
MPKGKKARAVGFNHIALEVGDIDEALAPPAGSRWVGSPCEGAELQLIPVSE